MTATELLNNKDFFAIALIESIKLMAEKSGKSIQELYALYKKQEQGFMDELTKNINACAEMTAKALA